MAMEAWQSLVHVCRRWRSLVFGSRRRLNLQLFCTPETPAKDTLDVWPALPLVVAGNMALSSGTDNIIAALGQTNRVREVFLQGLADWQLENVLAAMEVPFPELTELQLCSAASGESPPVIPVPDSFLGGSAPRLQYFELSGIPFPGLPSLLSSASHLVHLRLPNFPHSAYISPEAMVVLLCTLPSLEIFFLEFKSPQSRPDGESRSLPPPKRSVLSFLDHFLFKGAIEYLEEFVTHIDTPQLDHFYITFFNQIDFITPRLAQFINRTPKLKKRNAGVRFEDDFAFVLLSSGSSTLEISVSCKEPDWQLSSIAQVCHSSLRPLSTVEDLYIRHEYMELVCRNNAIDNTLWLELLLPFTAVKNLYLRKEFAPGIAVALKDSVGEITELLPSLQNIFVQGLEPSGPFQENIGRFVATRQLSGHPIAILKWAKMYISRDLDSDSDMEPM